MPLGILTDEQLREELEKLGKVPTEIGTVKDIEKGRGENSKEVPEALRSLIGITALEGSRGEARALAQAFGISDSSVSAYSNGATSTASYHNPDKDLKRKLDDTKNKITSKAKSRLLDALESITPEKLENAKLRDASSVARDMSAIVRNLENPNEGSASNVNVVVYAPRMRDESAFEVIEVGE